jgi:hypothetical protein
VNNSTLSAGARDGQALAAGDAAISRGERLAQLERALVRMTPYGARLAPIRIRAWRGEAFSGYFLRLDRSTLALHVGGGQYVWLDVERDLDGLLPGEAIRQLRPRD